MNEYFSHSQWSNSPTIPHYYGDYVRILFIIIVIVSAIAIPILGGVLPVSIFAQVLSILILVLLAGLTNPHGTIVLWLDTIISALGVLFLENAAVSSYSSTELPPVFFVQEVLVVVFVLALYFSIKTVRAMTRHQVGHSTSLGEFDTPEEKNN